jgi:hypothetical protein
LICGGIRVALQDEELQKMLYSVRWSAPIMVSLLPGADRQFDCVHDALDFLEHEWPGRHHQRARQALRAALAREISAEEARDAFISACIECGILSTQRLEIARSRRSKGGASGPIAAVGAFGVAGGVMGAESVSVAS